MEKNWINFYNKLDGKKLYGYTENGSFESEQEFTIGLLAYDNNIETTDIEIRKEVIK